MRYLITDYMKKKLELLITVKGQLSILRSNKKDVCFAAGEHSAVTSK